MEAYIKGVGSSSNVCNVACGFSLSLYTLFFVYLGFLMFETHSSNCSRNWIEEEDLFSGL